MAPTETASIRQLGIARFFMERLRPQTCGLFAAIMAGGRSMMEFDDTAL
jgi:hypothetical protein